MAFDLVSEIGLATKPTIPGKSLKSVWPTVLAIWQSEHTEDRMHSKSDEHCLKTGHAFADRDQRNQIAHRSAKSPLLKFFGLTHRQQILINKKVFKFPLLGVRSPHHHTNQAT